jgi:aldehyde dehydrogenase (NAD+)
MTALDVRPRSDLDAAGLVRRLRSTFDSGLTRPEAWRRSQLAQLRRLLVESEPELLAALRSDLGKSATEAYTTEIGFVLGEITHVEKHLSSWMRPSAVKLPLKLRPGRASIVSEPLGVALVIAPWNYPVHLLLAPMVAALAAGNCVVGKPSEVTPHVSAALARLVPRYLDERAVAIVEGGVDETTALLEQPLGHVFYTGNGRVGRVVMAAAARHLTPVTLELGGKSPAIVDRTADVRVAARRIAWGKFVNAGQTCVAPDHVLVHRDVESRLVDELVKAVRDFYGDDPSTSADYGRVVDVRHWRRLRGLLAAGGYASVVCGGGGDEATRYLAPTILTGVDRDAAVMGEEIFGPILPVLAVDDTEDAIEFVRSGDKPLALYVFGNDAVAERVLEATSSGGACVNATLLHLAVPELPFGGVGESGSGAYHGRTGFDTFSHRKSVLQRPTRPDPSVMYPPYTRLKDRLLRRFM